MYLKISVSSAAPLLLFPVHREYPTDLFPVFSFLSNLHSAYFPLSAKKLPIPAFEQISPTLIFSDHFSHYPGNVPEKSSVHRFFWKEFLFFPALFFLLPAGDSTLPG